MSAFLDTGVLVAISNLKDKKHREAVELIRRAAQGEYGTIFSSDYIFDETVTLALMRTRDPAIAISAGELLLGNSAKGVPSPVKLLHVDDETFSDSWAIFKRYSGRGLSFTDCTTLALMKRANIDILLSFDRSFDGIVKRAGK